MGCKGVDGSLGVCTGERIGASGQLGTEGAPFPPGSSPGPVFAAETAQIPHGIRRRSWYARTPLAQPVSAAEIAQIGPYRVVELTAHGGAGRIFRCVHEHTGQAAAVKIPLGASIYEREALRREIALLSRLSQLEYTSVVRLIESGADAGMPWYAMEHIQGVHLASYRDTLWGAGETVRDGTRAGSGFRSGQAWPEGFEEVGAATKTLPSPTWPPTPTRDSALHARSPRRPDASEAAAGHLADVLRIGACLADGLDLIHCEGVVHGDLTPRNVIIRESSGEPVLLDFGTSFLAFRAGVGRELMHVVGRPQGTPAYVSPEAVEARPLDARCDLYALGCILFELLTGRRVFSGPDAQAVMYLHRTAIAPRASDFVTGVPDAVDELINRMLAKEPTERVGRAREVATALRAAIGEEPGVSEQIPDRNPLLFPPRLYDRTAVLEDLCLRLPVLGRLTGGLALVHGESGSGKTRLVNEVAVRARQAGVLVVSGQCLETGAETASGIRATMALEPFEPVLQLVADRCAVGGGRDWKSEFSDHLALLEPYAPAALHPVVSSHEAVALPPELGRGRVLRCLLELLVALGKEQPLLVLIDDLQWADELTLEFLREHSAELKDSGVLLLGTYRREHTNDELTALASRALVEHGLERLTASGLHNLAKDMLGARFVPEGLVPFLSRHSEGNPFFAAEYLRAALGRGLLRYGGGGEWEFEATSDVDMPRSLGALFELRLDSLSPPAARLLQLAAVLGREFDLPLLQALPGNDGRVDEDALEELVAAEIIEWRGPERYRFVHSKLREAQSAALSPSVRRRLHRSIAVRLEELRGARDESTYAEDLGIHWAEAGEPEQALPHLEEAARAAEARYARVRCIDLYREAIRQCEELHHNAPARFRRRLCQLEERLGDALIVRAQHGEARAAFERAHSLTQTGDHQARARIFRKKASSHWMLHEYSRAEELLEFAEKALGTPGAGDVDENRERIEILTGRLEVLYFSGRVGDEMARLVNEIGSIVNQYGTAVQRQTHYVAAFSQAYAQGRYAFSQAVVDLARKCLPDDVGALPLNLAAQSGFSMGFALMSGTRDDCTRALEWFRAAAAAAERAGDTTLLSRILVYQTLALLRLGDVDATQEMAKRVMFAAESAQLLPYVAAANAFECWVLWRRDAVADARTRAARAIEIWSSHAHPFPFKWAALLPLLDMQQADGVVEATRSTLTEILSPTQQALPQELTAALKTALATCDGGSERAVRDAVTYAISLASYLGYC